MRPAAEESLDGDGESLLHYKCGKEKSGAWPSHYWTKRPLLTATDVKNGQPANFQLQPETEAGACVRWLCVRNYWSSEETKTNKCGLQGKRDGEATVVAATVCKGQHRTRDALDVLVRGNIWQQKDKQINTMHYREWRVLGFEEMVTV